MNNEPDFHEIEQGVGPPLVPPADMGAVDAHREAVYSSYEIFLRRQLEALDAARPAAWQRDYKDEAAYLASIAPMRDRFKAMLGWWEEPGQRDAVTISDEETFHEDDDFVARRFYFDVMPGLVSYAVELAPKVDGARPGLLLQHGYGGTPELICGFARSANDEDYCYRSVGLRAVRRGYHVVAVHHPTGYGVADESIVDQALPAFPQYPATYGKNRLHRMAVMAGGRSLIGLDMMASSRGVDLLAAREAVDDRRIAMYGLSQGGTSTLYLAAMDERIRASVAGAWFQHRIRKMIGPSRVPTYLDSPEEDKFFTLLLPLFSDCDVVSLIAPRAIAIEAGELDGAVAFEDAWREFQRAHAHYEKLGIPARCEFIAHKAGHVSATARAFDFLAEQSG